MIPKQSLSRLPRVPKGASEKTADHVGRKFKRPTLVLSKPIEPLGLNCTGDDSLSRAREGRSQHIRHKHPVVANARRIAARLEEITKKRADRAAAAEAIGQRRRGCWSDEEVAVLVEKESELKKTGVKQINAALARFLPGRSQHVRHKHPVVANARRIAARLEEIAKKRADRAAAAEAIGQRRRGCWSDEEVAVLVEKEFELMKTGVKQINAAIARFLPGRSQHIWHKHPVVANARRIAARLEEIAKKRADRAATAEATGQRRRGCWSDEEVAVLVEKEFELMKTGVKQINAAIARFLPDKTAKQVGSKRAVLAKRAHKSHQGSEQSTTTTNSQSLIGGEPQSSSDWKDLFPGSACPGHTRWSAVFSEALLELVEDGTAIAWGSFENAIEDWVEHYKSRREVTNNRRNLARDRNIPNTSNFRPRRRDKRQAYARHQDLFRKNRKKLLAVVLGENREREYPIPIYAIEEFYKGRLSAPGPEVDLKKYPSSSQVENDSILSPFSVEEIKVSRKQMKISSAAVPDGITIGRSQHVRHKHPVVANARRIAARLEEIAKKRADRAAAAEAIGQRRRGCWSDEEVAVLVKKEFELMKTGVKQINAAIARFLPGKTAKQVGSKRAVLAKRAHKSHQGSEQSTTTTNSQSQIGGEPQSSSDWVDLFPGSACPGHTRWSAVFSEALLELVEDGTAIAWGSFENAIEDWVEHYKSRREVTNNKRNIDSDRHTSNLYKSSSRRRDKRQAYARHQDLFKKNRKKLLAVVLGENSERECPIPIYAIEEFYKNRLSAPGPEVDLRNYPSSSQIENDYLESILRGGD
ncbi:Hypothetical predicted protein [Octopus vulgaris]|uniref:Uncharacterized protein n=1 Tax=Octopus vulgaris TaxID=6645 RepID=A0AA36FGL9_OCTVU|nr:Hypothetical predicted protein [Octopus vulgaris]